MRRKKIEYLIALRKHSLNSLSDAAWQKKNEIFDLNKTGLRKQIYMN